MTKFEEEYKKYISMSCLNFFTEDSLNLCLYRPTFAFLRWFALACENSFKKCHAHRKNENSGFC